MTSLPSREPVDDDKGEFQVVDDKIIDNFFSMKY